MKELLKVKKGGFGGIKGVNEGLKGVVSYFSFLLLKILVFKAIRLYSLTESFLMDTSTTSLIVVKSNSIIQASYKLSLAEQRLLLACIAQIDSKKELDNNIVFEVSASEIDDLAGLEKHKSSYRDLKKASEQIMKRVIRIDNPDPENPALTHTLTHWVESCDYYPSEGKVGVTFSKKIIPYLSQLSANFTKYKLTHVAKMKSVYSIRLYELLVQWQSMGEREIEIDWLRKMFLVEDKYPAIKDLKKNVIEPAIKEINEHSNLWVKYGQRRTGRSISHFQFKYGLKNFEKINQKFRQITEEEINKSARPGETRPQVIARLTGNQVENYALPGESFDQALARKKELAEVKKRLK